MLQGDKDTFVSLPNSRCSGFERKADVVETLLAMGFRRTGSSVYKGVPMGHLSGSDAWRSFLRPVRPRLPLLFPLDSVCVLTAFVLDSSILQYELDPPAGETRQRPLFVHSNLLKHISGVRQGDTFTHIVSTKKSKQAGWLSEEI